MSKSESKTTKIFESVFSNRLADRHVSRKPGRKGWHELADLQSLFHYVSKLDGPAKKSETLVPSHLKDAQLLSL